MIEKAHIALINYVVDNGYRISVFDGEEMSSVCSADIPQIIHNCEAVEMSWLIVKTPEGQVLGEAVVIPYGVGREETVADFSDNEFFNDWFDRYQDGIDAIREEIALHC